MAPSIPFALSPPYALLSALARAAVLTVLPDGGQAAARHNAWAGMSAGSTRRRLQREADLAIEAAQARASARDQAHAVG